MSAAAVVWEVGVPLGMLIIRPAAGSGRGAARAYAALAAGYVAFFVTIGATMSVPPLFVGMYVPAPAASAGALLLRAPEGGGEERARKKAE